MARVRQYIIKKYVMATSAMDAIRKENKHRVDDVWLDEEWVKSNPEPKENNLGYGKKD